MARTARVAETTETIRKMTLIVPRTICSGPTMVLLLPRASEDVGVHRPPDGEVVPAQRRVDRGTRRPGAPARMSSHDSGRAHRLLTGNYPRLRAGSDGVACGRRRPLALVPPTARSGHRPPAAARGSRPEGAVGAVARRGSRPDGAVGQPVRRTARVRGTAAKRRCAGPRSAS